MAEVSKNDSLKLSLDITNGLTEEIHDFGNKNNQRENLIFYSVSLLVSLGIMVSSFYIGEKMYPDKESIPNITEALKLTDEDYIQETATNAALISEKESLTQASLEQQEELSKLKNFSDNKESLEKKLGETKAEYEKLNNELTKKKAEAEAHKNQAYSITLNPGVYTAGVNIPAATFEATGNGSIIASSSAKETKINEKLSPTIPVTVKFFEGYTIKVNAVTKFIIKE